MFDMSNQQFILEITVLSAEGLKNTSSALFSHRRLRPFVSIAALPPSPSPSHRDKQCRVYQTRVDNRGGLNPTWGDKFRVPLDATFFANRYSSIYLQLYTKTLISGKAQLGWCQIPVSDIGLPPVGSVSHLSYRLRARDGSRGHGIVNIAVKLESSGAASGQSNTCQTVIGIPVTMLPRVNELGRCNGSGTEGAKDERKGCGSLTDWAKKLPWN